jgi:hypothetical protein
LREQGKSARFPDRVGVNAKRPPENGGQARTRAARKLEFEGLEVRLGAAIGAVDEPDDGGEHAEPAEEAEGVADFLVVEEEVPLAEEEEPIAGFGADEGQGVHASIGHVGADVEKVFEEPEGREGDAVGLALKEEIDGAGGGNDEFEERAAEKHEGVAEEAEEGMAGFVDHEVDEIGEKEIGGVEPGVEEKEDVENEPGAGAETRDGFPFAEVFEAQVHGNRVAAVGAG